MTGPFYFAWAGSGTDPAFTLETFGDVWGGSIDAAGDLWNGELIITADTEKFSTAVTNLSDTTSLRVGKTYSIEGSGIPAGAAFTYGGGNDISISPAPSTTGSGITVTITNSAETKIITNLDITDGLLIGSEYHIAGSGIPFGATFVYDGGDSITISDDVTKTASGSDLAISSLDGRNIVSNLSDTTGLVDGQVYSISGIGIPGGATFRYESSDDFLTMFQNASASGTQISLTISKGITENDGGSFNPAVHNVENEKIFSFEITQSEGKFASLKIQLINPRIGLLAPARKRWCFLSWFNGTSIVCLFHGRILGTAEDITNNRVQLEFIAIPNDYAQQRATLANGMRDLPYFDPVWIDRGKVDDPNSVLETRSKLWDTDRVTMNVAVTDIISGEDGTIEILTSEHMYSAVSVSEGEPPKRQITVVASVSWPQAAEGTVDISDDIARAMISAGSPYASPNIGSLTSEGLLSQWPQPGTDISGGWSVDVTSKTTSAVSHVPTAHYKKKFSAKDNSVAVGGISITGDITNGDVEVFNIISTDDLIGGLYDVTGTEIPDDTTMQYHASDAKGTLSNAATDTVIKASMSVVKHKYGTTDSGLEKGFKNYNIMFDLTPLSVSLIMKFSAIRDRVETATFTLLADVQPILADAEGADIENISLSSDLVAQPVDLDGTYPIGDPSSNTFFATDRGIKSIEFLLLMAATKLKMSARAVKVKFRTAFAKLATIVNCRKNVLLHDQRLPGGQVSGKIIEYRMSYASRTGNTFVDCTIGCTIGTGGELVAADPGVDSYADDYSDDYDEMVGGTVDIEVGELQYQSLDGTYVIDDDGVDFSNMIPATVIDEISVRNGPFVQQGIIDTAADSAEVATDVSDALKNSPTRIELIMIPVDGGPFQTNFIVKPAKLALPKTINLEAA